MIWIIALWFASLLIMWYIAKAIAYREAHRDTYQTAYDSGYEIGYKTAQEKHTDTIIKV